MEALLSRTGISESKLDEKCSDERIPTIAYSLIGWRALLPHLGLTEADQEEIEIDGHNEPEKRQRVLRMWRKQKGAKATYKQLIVALIHVKNIDYAEEVCRLLASDGMLL